MFAKNKRTFFSSFYVFYIKLCQRFWAKNTPKGMSFRDILSQQRCTRADASRLLLSRCRAIKQTQIKNSHGCKHPGSFDCISFAPIVVRADYLLLNCGARRAAFKPYFFLSFILGSLVKKPAFFNVGLNSSESTLSNALAIP